MSGYVTYALVLLWHVALNVTYALVFAVKKTDTSVYVALKLAIVSLWHVGVRRVRRFKTCDSFAVEKMDWPQSGRSKPPSTWKTLYASTGRLNIILIRFSNRRSWRRQFNLNIKHIELSNFKLQEKIRWKLVCVFIVFAKFDHYF